MGGVYEDRRVEERKMSVGVFVKQNDRKVNNSLNIIGSMIVILRCQFLLSLSL
jgi:hypothetical protein